MLIADASSLASCLEYVSLNKVANTIVGNRIRLQGLGVIGLREPRVADWLKWCRCTQLKIAGKGIDEGWGGGA